MGLLKPRPALAFGHMEVRVDTDAPDVAEQVVRVSNGLAACETYADVFS
jgi:DNA mismatch repair protein MSH5